MLSAKQKVDNAVYANQLQAAKAEIQVLHQHRDALQNKIAADARRPKKEQILRPVHPSIALEIAYRRKIGALISDMNDSVLYWLKAAFKANEPEVTTLVGDSMVEWGSGLRGSTPPNPAVGEFRPHLAADALPARELRRAVRKLARRWQRNFNKASEELAEWFSRRVHQRSTQTLQSILRRGGWTVDLKMTPAQRDILAATIQQNVSLIRSIPAQYFTQIEGMVMRSVQTGRDLKQLTNDLQRTFRVTRKRAELIARDQNNKATAATTRARQIELGLTEAIWVHSGAGRHPRPTHVRNNGKRYDVRTGWWVPAVRRYIHPGTEINCRCTSRSVIPGFT